MTKKEKKIIKIASPMQQYLVLYKRREIRNQFTCNIQESRMHVSDVSGYFAKKNLQISYIFARTSSRTCNRSKIGRGETGMSDRKRGERDRWCTAVQIGLQRT